MTPSDARLIKEALFSQPIQATGHRGLLSNVNWGVATGTALFVAVAVAVVLIATSIGRALA